MAQMRKLDKPLTKAELKKFDELLHSEKLLEAMVERAIRGREGSGRRTRKSTLAS